MKLKINQKRDANGKYPKPKRPDKLKGCNHNEHSWYPYLGLWMCESAGQFVCGNTGLLYHPKSVCNVCETNFGNLYCLDRHLGESKACRDGFQMQFYGVRLFKED